jgi:hypothetical protein
MAGGLLGSCVFFVDAPVRLATLGYEERAQKAGRYKSRSIKEGTLRHQSSDANHPVLRPIGRVLPTNYYSQEFLSTALWNEWSGKIEDSARFQRIDRSVGVERAR